MSLSAFRDYCRTMAEEAEEYGDRRLWEQLTDELDAYLADQRDTEPDEPDDLLAALEQQVAEQRRRQA